MNLYQSTDSKTLHDAGIWYTLKKTKSGMGRELFKSRIIKRTKKQQSCRDFTLQLKNNVNNPIQLCLLYIPREEIKWKKPNPKIKMKMLSALESCFCNSGQGGLLTVLTNHSSWTPRVCFASCQHAILLHLGPSEGEKIEIVKGVIEFQAIRLLERFYSMTFVFESECVCIV